MEYVNLEPSQHTGINKLEDFHIVRAFSYYLELFPFYYKKSIYKLTFCYSQKIMIFLKYFIFNIVVNGKRSVAAFKTYNNRFRDFNVKSYFVSMKIKYLII